LTVRRRVPRIEGVECRAAPGAGRGGGADLGDVSGGMKMDRRAFIKVLGAGAAGVVLLVMGTGCPAPLVSSRAWDGAKGSPWRCLNCGHLTRSDEDLTNIRCPHCGTRMLTRITEEEMEQRLKVIKAREGA
jgi:DNA-directed RNA polymerase subunit RPC12/RpoP